ncbi:hypothetical protein PoB_007379800 [Plakobranchus ocellatus]|uniref:Uncharacterized protein n=1 Tax=Plakobranchus ocellatus TaxID=259542 RepID=A0AAV4DSI7_9GAST|nr:hypothetical protein PoB_007379800 [Plakobranchus ocellatus]
MEVAAELACSRLKKLEYFKTCIVGDTNRCLSPASHRESHSSLAIRYSSLDANEHYMESVERHTGDPYSICRTTYDANVPKFQSHKKSHSSFAVCHWPHRHGHVTLFMRRSIPP